MTKLTHKVTDLKAGESFEEVSITKEREQEYAQWIAAQMSNLLANLSGRRVFTVSVNIHIDAALLVDPPQADAKAEAA